jgi:membrane-associated phospholipid phosphatase
MKRHPKSSLVVPVWLFSESLAAATASLRVVAGKHFITDVITGAAAGTAIGILIPYLHQKTLPDGVLAFASRLRFSAFPTFSAGGGGLLLTIE